MRVILILVIGIAAIACSSGPNTNVTTNKASNTATTRSTPAPVYTYEIVKSYPHDPKAFTEGLYYKDGYLYESTGEEKQSSLRKVELETGKVVQKWDLPPEDFGEGIAEVNGKIYQMTWRQQLGRIFDAADFKLLQEFNYQGEGWGMTTDGSNLVRSDGTHLLRFAEPESFRTVRTLAVFQSPGKPLFLLNELEWIKGEIWANIWHSEQLETETTQGTMPNIGRPNMIARIDPTTGNVVGWVDLSGISPGDQPSTTDPEAYREDPKAENTLNGIAYDATNDRIFVTGKRWKKLYEIRIKPKE